MKSSFAKEILAEKKDFAPALSFVALRHIADFIGTLNQEDAIEFLKSCGVPKNKIDQHKSPSNIIYYVLKSLAVSSKIQDRELLERIINQSTNPALYGKNDISTQKIITQYNEWLNGDDFEMAVFHNRVVFLDKQILNLYAKPYVEEDFIASIKTEVVERISEIRYAYKLLIRIINIFSQNSIRKSEMNSFYIKLFKIVEEDIEYAHSHTENIFGEDESESNIEYQFMAEKHSLMSGNYIQPYIYQNEYGKNTLYMPFLNLYSAQSEMEKESIDWTFVQKCMNECYAVLEDRFYRFGADKTTNYPHKEYLDKVKIC